MKGTTGRRQGILEHPNYNEHLSSYLYLLFTLKL
jgi:hypothetical protein